MPPVLLTIDDTGKRVRWSQAIPGGQINHLVSISSYDVPTGDIGEPKIPEDVYWRLLCHVLTNWMPNDALPEMGEALGEMFQFYRDRGSEVDTKYLPHFSESEMEILEPVDRPLFQLAEE